MMRKVLGEITGLSDIGTILSPSQFDKADVDDYILHEDNEKIYFVIKTKKDEYCFTNLALLHLDGESAVSSKRKLKRYDYFYNAIDEVILETAGTIDLDVEIKFTIGSENISIDVKKDQISQLKGLYKTLIAISTLQDVNKAKFNYAMQGQELASGYLKRPGIPTESDVVTQFENIRESIHQYSLKIHEQYLRLDYKEQFEKYIKN